MKKVNLDAVIIKGVYKKVYRQYEIGFRSKKCPCASHPWEKRMKEVPCKKLYRKKKDGRSIDIFRGHIVEEDMVGTLCYLFLVKYLKS